MVDYKNAHHRILNNLEALASRDYRFPLWLLLGSLLPHHVENLGKSAGWRKTHVPAVLITLIANLERQREHVLTNSWPRSNRMAQWAQPHLPMTKFWSTRVDALLNYKALRWFVILQYIIVKMDDPYILWWIWIWISLLSIHYGIK